VTVADLERVVASVPTVYRLDQVEVKTSGDFYNSPGGEARFGYACCAMGNCWWSEVPQEYFQPVVYIPSSYGPD
jgi:hypothetical protein